jgi:putative DNA-invertase from lambdoid prophage Rac
VLKTSLKPVVFKTKKQVVFDHPYFFTIALPSQAMKAALYARVSTADQKTLKSQLDEMRSFARARRWAVSLEVKEVGSGAKTRPKREELLQTARRREIDAVIVWKLDRWGRSVSDLVTTLEELRELGVQFVSLRDALDFTTSTGRALAGMLAIFAEFERDILRERVRAGLAAARLEGRVGGRPKATTEEQRKKIRTLHSKGVNKAQIARQLGFSRMTVRRVIDENQ